MGYHHWWNWQQVGICMHLALDASSRQPHHLTPNDAHHLPSGLSCLGDFPRGRHSHQWMLLPMNRGRMELHAYAVDAQEQLQSYKK